MNVISVLNAYLVLRRIRCLMNFVYICSTVAGSWLLDSRKIPIIRTVYLVRLYYVPVVQVLYMYGASVNQGTVPGMTF